MLSLAIVTENSIFSSHALSGALFRFDRRFSFTSFIKNMTRKPAFFLFCCVLFFCSNQRAFAQNSDYKNAVSVTTGLNGWQIVALLDNFIEADSVVGAYMKASPTFGVSYDMGLLKWFSLGVHANFNRGEIGADDLTINVDGKEYTGVARLQLRRYNLGFRPLFHYGNNGRFDWYSGFRVGVNYRVMDVNIGTDADITDYEVINRLIGNSWLLNRNYRGVRPTFQLIPLGFRAHFTENLGLGVETALGAPYYLNAQLTYRF